jgi:hypothetical protein
MGEQSWTAFQAAALRWVRVEHHAQLFMPHTISSARMICVTGPADAAAVELPRLPPVFLLHRDQRRENSLPANE